MNRPFFIFVSTILGIILFLSSCVQYSRDEIPDIQSLWVSDAYLTAQSGDSRALLVKQAKVFLDNGDYDEAWRRLNRETFRFISDPELSFLRGKAAFYLENYSDARRYLQDARELGYAGDELFYLIAANELALGDAEAAIGTVNTLLRLEQKPSFFTLKADVLLQTGDTLAATQEYRKSLKADSTIRNNYLGLARIKAGRPNLEEALNLADRWLKAHPDDVEFLYLKARILELSDQFREAGKVYAGIPSPNDGRLLALRARNYLEQGKADSAALMANQSIVYRDSVATRLILARALERQRLYDDAEGAYREIVEKDSTQTEAQTALRRLEQRREYLQYLRERQRVQETDSSSGQEQSINPSDSTSQ